jgi:hypothetical protein
MTFRRLGVVGGQVVHADGSTIWKRIDRMYQEDWTYSGDGGHRGAL